MPVVLLCTSCQAALASSSGDAVQVTVDAVLEHWRRAHPQELHEKMQELEYGAPVDSMLARVGKTGGESARDGN